MPGKKELHKQKFQLSDADYHLTPEQIIRLISAGNLLRDQILLQLFAETGIRRSEAANLDIDDIKFADSLLVIRQGKGEKLRLVPITKELKVNLTKLVKSHQTSPVFISRNNRRLSTRQINRIVANCGMNARIENPNPKYDQITPHLLRHSFARLWKERSGDIETLSKIMGHSSVSTTWDLYGKSGLQDIQRQYLKIMQKVKFEKL